MSKSKIGNLNSKIGLLLLAALASSTAPGRAGTGTVPLPAGVKAVWDPALCWREKTPTRERRCLNGLWRFQPARAASEPAPPPGGWGYFKVPGPWPGITDYLQKDTQTLYSHPDWKGADPAALAAWYEREIWVPRAWAGRRIALTADTLNSYATVFVDGRGAGELRFPGGELDLTPHLSGGGPHRLALRVLALPLHSVLLSFRDTASARPEPGQVARRGLCGDLFLVSTPKGARLEDVRVRTSVRRWEIGLEAAVAGPAPRASYRLRARIVSGGRRVREFLSAPFRAGSLRAGRYAFRAKWKPKLLWDTDTPQNTALLTLDLLDAKDALLDRAHPVRFGFREWWIRGRDFVLNRARLHLSAVPLDSTLSGAAWASYAGAKETLLRLKSIGINFVYTHHYSCEPGAHLALEEILTAADDTGMLVALTMPHFSHYEWPESGAKDFGGDYARHAAYYVRVAAGHPSVVCYAMSHNATGYSEDMNPDLIDGLQAPRDRWALKNARLALPAERIVRRLDPGRIVYHHASGNLGALHTSNFYPNFAPIQELSDWFEPWSKRGVKPLFLCEYGAPFTWDWTMYHGWYRGEREFGSARVPWEFCLAEWNAQFLGDRAYNLFSATP